MKGNSMKILGLVLLGSSILLIAVATSLPAADSSDANKAPDRLAYAAENDVDGDGVSDDLDICDDTPQGVKVDGLGCPLDSDGDYVADYLDKCPDTPKLTHVDANGCPAEAAYVPQTHFVCCHEVSSSGIPVEFDVDRDGVPDAEDECLGTPVGAKVDARGCWVIQDLQFDKDKWDIGASDHQKLDNIVAFMLKNPEVKLTVLGHTNSEDSADQSQIIAEKRANAVLEYISSHGVDRNRLSATGGGTAEPRQMINLIPTQ
jgi:OOP family OmpA-OmpF porin